MVRQLCPERVYLYDTTLRDGAQGRGISFSLNDKLRLASLISDLGVPYLEGGWPGSNPKDCEFFSRATKLNLPLKLVAFGSTRRKGSKADQDANLQALLKAETPAVALVGKSWTLHVTHVLEAELEENLAMIAESVSLMRQSGREVVYDAEHFFDGYRADRPYAVATLKAALEAGAGWLVLCDTNGGSLPAWVDEVVRGLVDELGPALSLRSARLGIHAHNDSELAVANSLAAVQAGCLQVQGTINGYGERCGNANLVSVAANLELKMERACLGTTKLAQLAQLSHAVSEIANMAPDPRAPFVGAAAFSHKGGIHVAAVEKVATSYEHIAPEKVGNTREVLISELAGRGNIRMRAKAAGVDTNGRELQLLQRIKELEAKGYQFELAEGSFELLLHRLRSDYEKPFEVSDVMVVSDRKAGGQAEVQAIVKLTVAGELMHTAAAGDGPVHALDGALRKALVPVYPEIAQVHLVDYKVRILDPEKATAATTRVVIEAMCGAESWCTTGCSGNIMDASLQALTDSFEYFLLKCAKAGVRQESAVSTA